MCEHELMVKELEEEIRQLKDTLYNLSWDVPAELGLSATRARILAALVRHDRYLPAWFLFDASRGAGCWVDEIASNVVQSNISTIRRALKPFGLEIESHRSRGYRLTPASRERLTNWNTNTAEAA